MDPSDACDQEVFDKGVSLLAIDGWAKDVEPWVRKVAKKSGQRVDWHYSGGVAHVLVLGDHAKAMRVAAQLESELVWVEPDNDWYRERGMTPGDANRRNPTIIQRYTGHGDGLYRRRD